MEVEDEDGEVGEIVVVVEVVEAGVEVGFVTGEELVDGDVQETVTGAKLNESIREKRGEGKVALDQEKGGREGLGGGPKEILLEPWKVRH